MVILMGNRAELQGTPWHYEKAKKGCQDGSKYCVYNLKNHCTFSLCKDSRKKCIGKGACQFFEPKTGTPKVYSAITYQQKTIVKESNSQMNATTNEKNSSDTVSNQDKS